MTWLITRGRSMVNLEHVTHIRVKDPDGYSLEHRLVALTESNFENGIELFRGSEKTCQDILAGIQEGLRKGNSMIDVMKVPADYIPTPKAPGQLFAHF
ncbi:MAG: hypothetical protein R2880_13045 [Deinococcales bacterium]